MAPTASLGPSEIGPHSRLQRRTKWPDPPFSFFWGLVLFLLDTSKSGLESFLNTWSEYVAHCSEDITAVILHFPGIMLDSIHENSLSAAI